MMKQLCMVMLYCIMTCCGVSARVVRFTILHTTDLEGHLLPKTQSDGNRVGGLLRCAKVIREIRREESHVLLIDCGNLFGGSIESEMTRGRIMAKALDDLAYDAWVPGHHDWRWGVEQIDEIADTFSFAVLAANIDVRVGRNNPVPNIRPFVIKEVEGVRVAIVGLTNPQTSQWMLPESLGDLQFTDSLSALQNVMPLVRQARPDVLILAAHQGLLVFDDEANQIRAISKMFPEFDVILGGQTQQRIEDRRLDGTLYSQAGKHGLSLGRVNVTFDTVAGDVIQKSSHLHDISGVKRPDANLEDLLSSALSRAESYGSQVIGVTLVDLKEDPAEGRSRSVKGVICKAIHRATGAEIVLYGNDHFVEMSKGEIRMRDAWDLVPRSDGVATFELNSSQLQEILEENARLVDTPQFLAVYGLRYDLNTRAPTGKRVSNVRLSDGTTPHPKRKLKVAAGASWVASAGGHFPVLRALAGRPRSNLNMTGIDIRKALIEYIREESPLEEATGNSRE